MSLIERNGEEELATYLSEGGKGGGWELYYMLLNKYYASDEAGAKYTDRDPNLQLDAADLYTLQQLGALIDVKEESERVETMTKELEKLLPAISMASNDSAIKSTPSMIIDFFQNQFEKNVTADDFSSNLEKFLEKIEIDNDAGSTAEVLIMEYFDEVSRRSVSVSKTDAALFQKDVLRDSLAVNNVKMFQGATIFDCSFTVGCKKEQLAEKLEEKFSRSGLKDQFKYTLVMNEKLPTTE